MDVKLVVQKSGKPGQTFHVRSAEMIVGRQKGCGVRIPSGDVSRQHCILTFSDDLLSVEDLSSANGTFLNGRRISKREFLRPGDKLRVGPVTLLVQYQLTQAAVDRLLQEEEEVAAIAPLDNVEVLPEFDGGEVELVLEEEDEGPLPVDEDLDVPADPLEALRAIEEKSGGAPPPAPAPVPKKINRARTPAPAPVDDDVDDEVTIAPGPPQRVKLTDAGRATAPAASAEPEDDADDQAAPDASQILGHKNWQLPTGEDIRDILAQIEKGKKKS
ncbi:MAG: FHA domain-containing protein [Gemmataceae bacterium]|nr:FHA domain-containing protein [Gemmataceae bacterium]